MRIEELLVEQQLDELGIGQAIGKGVGGIAKGLGAVAGGAAGAWDQAKAGYQAARSTVGGKNAPYAAQQAASQPAPTNAGGTTTVGNNTTQGDTATMGTSKTVGTPPVASPNAPAANPAVAAQADQQAKVGVKQINSIIPGLRTRDLKSIQNTINTRMQALNKNPTGAAAPTNAQTATGTQPNLSLQQGGKQTAPIANAAAAVNPAARQAFGGGVSESTEFYSKFLGKNI